MPGMPTMTASMSVFSHESGHCLEKRVKNVLSALMAHKHALPKIVAESLGTIGF